MNTRRLYALNPEKYKNCYIDENDSDIAFHLKTVEGYDVNLFFDERLIDETEMIQFGQSVSTFFY